MDKYAVFLDFDGTLSYGKNLVSKENIDAIKKVQALGNYVFISTGRSYVGIEPVASKIHEFDGYISGLGSNICLNGQEIYGKYYDYDVVEKFVADVIDSGCNYVFGCTDKIYAINPAELQKELFPAITSMGFFRENLKDRKIQKIESMNVDWTKEELNRLKSMGEVYVHSGYTECCPSGCSKSSAIKIVAEKLGIKHENTIAMGDSANDLDMIEEAGVGVVMGNAADFVKEKADFITKPCREHGVAYALEELILNKM